MLKGTTDNLKELLATHNSYNKINRYYDYMIT